jgi:hypothetical protein
MMIIEDDARRLHAVSATGPFMQANILPISGQGKVRVTYNWLYSSLNCDPNDPSTFPWTFVKLDDTHVALSPVLTYQGMTLYASVRPDIGYCVQVQAPGSADWITGIGGDETITLNMRDLSLGTFQGLNGSYIAVNPVPDSHDDHAGNRLFSNGGDPNAALFLIQPTTALQAGFEFRQTRPWTPERLKEVVGRQGVALSPEQSKRLAFHLQ